MPLDDAAFQAWAEEKGLAPGDFTYLAALRAAQPVRRLRATPRSGPVRFPSRKMGAVVQCRSRLDGLPMAYELEHDPAVLEYYDLPATLHLHYTARSGKRAAIEMIPDYLVIRGDGAGFIECRSEPELEALAAAAPERCVHEADGGWRCPPGERAAAAHGLAYRVRSRREVDWTLVANLDFLADFFGGQDADPSAPAIAEVLASVRQEPGITLREVLSLARDKCLSADVVYVLLVEGHLVADLTAQRLSAPESVVVFTDAEALAAWHLQQQRAGLFPTVPMPVSELPIGSIVNWDRRQWTLVQRSASMAVLHDAQGVALALELDRLAALLRSGELEMSDGRRQLSADGRQRLLEASPTDLATANRRLRLVTDVLACDAAETHTVPTSTRNDWVRRWKRAEQAYGWGYIGLLPGRRGNRTQRHLAEAVIAVMHEVADAAYWTSPDVAKSDHGCHRLGRAASVLAAYGVLARACTERGLECPSYRSWRRFLKVGATTERTARRHGPRIAYQQAEFAWQLELTTVRHGERPWQVCHVDHTPLDIHLVHSQTARPMGRPYATFLTDAFTRRLLAVSLTYDEPSYRSCYLVLLECVRRWGRLPDTIVVDGGAEFRSMGFETVAAACGMTIRQRPIAAARHGSVVERLFGSSNTQLVHNLTGTTAIARKPRQLTKRRDPSRLAVWTLADLDEALRTWAYEVHDTAEHPALGQSPRDAWLAAIEQAGTRLAGVHGVSLEDFRLLALPSTAKGTATVTYDEPRGSSPRRLLDSPPGTAGVAPASVDALRHLRPKRRWRHLKTRAPTPRPATSPTAGAHAPDGRALPAVQ
jgi:hypothetical protein